MNYKEMHHVMVKIKPALLFLLILTFFAAPVVTYAANPSDPFEKYNRFVYNINDGFDTVLFKPIAKVYNKILPSPVKRGVSNFFGNLNMIPTIINDLLQANFYQATSDTWRFTINSTVGLLGLVDVASMMGLQANSQDFGLTLAKWGITSAPYIVLPIFGPSTIRDAVALPINYYFFTVYPHIEPERTRYYLLGLNIISKRAALLRFEGVFKQAALDPYEFQRNAYLQRRAYLIKQLKEKTVHTDPFVEDAQDNSSEQAETTQPTDENVLPEKAEPPPKF